MKRIKYLLLIMLGFLPIVVFAGSGEEMMPVSIAIFIEAFVSIHMSIFVLVPLSSYLDKDGKSSSRIFWKLFFGRVAVLLFFDFFITPYIAFIDIFAIPVGVFALLIIGAASQKKRYVPPTTSAPVGVLPKNFQNMKTTLVLSCTMCGKTVDVNDTVCPHCGAAIEGDNIQVSSIEERILTPADFDQKYSLSEDSLIEACITDEFNKLGVDLTKNVIPAELLKKKTIMRSAFAILLCIYVMLIFFHFPITTYAIGAVTLVVFFLLTNKFNVKKYILKEVQSRPNEDIANIAATCKMSLRKDNSLSLFLAMIVVAILLPLIMFFNPHILYEEVDGGYAVRFYTFGVTNFTKAYIPTTHNGKPIVSLRGNIFSNMFFLKEVYLPDSITEIRGQAFKNDYKLDTVNIPENLVYLGGGAFYNCNSIRNITLPDTVTFLGGESFTNATSLESIKLSDNLTEIRGDTFSGCVKLLSITIPDKVERIGGHAFYGCTSLNEVNISQNSKLVEIGSSAFRNCSNLTSIKLPTRVYINERAFKNTPIKKEYYGEVTTGYNYRY